MAKILGVALLIGTVFFILNRDKIQEFKRNAIETINPAAKEKRLMGEIQGNINELDTLLHTKNPLSTSEQAKKIGALLNNAKQTLSELQQTNEKLDLGANLSHLIQKLIPLEDKPSPTWLPPAKGCQDKPS